LYLVSVCLFSCTPLFVSISQVIGCEGRLRNDLYCVGWGVKLCSLTHSVVMQINRAQLSRLMLTIIVCSMFSACCYGEAVRATGTPGYPLRRHQWRNTWTRLFPDQGEACDGREVVYAIYVSLDSSERREPQGLYNNWRGITLLWAPGKLLNVQRLQVTSPKGHWSERSRLRLVTSP